MQLLWHILVTGCILFHGTVGTHWSCVIFTLQMFEGELAQSILPLIPRHAVLQSWTPTGHPPLLLPLCSLLYMCMPRRNHGELWVCSSLSYYTHGCVLCPLRSWTQSKWKNTEKKKWEKHHIACPLQPPHPSAFCLAELMGFFRPPPSRPLPSVWGVFGD